MHWCYKIYYIFVSIIFVYYITLEEPIRIKFKKRKNERCNNCMNINIPL